MYYLLNTALDKLDVMTNFIVFQPVIHTVTVDHNPGGGHWLAAGLSPQVGLQPFYDLSSFMEHDIL